MAVKWRRLLLALVLVFIAPVLYIAGFNGLLGTSIAYTVNNWILVFLTEILVLLVFLVAFLIAKFILSPIGKRRAALIALIVLLLLLPVLFIWAFGVVVGVQVAYTLESYVLVFALIIAVALISGALEYLFY